MSAAPAPRELPLIRLPEPYKTKYELWQASSDQHGRIFQLQLAAEQPKSTQLPPQPLHHASLFFSDLVSDEPSSLPPPSNNTAWGRACRTPASYLTWEGQDAPTVGQLWNITYAIISLHPEEEVFRMSFSGQGSAQIVRELIETGLARAFPRLQDAEDRFRGEEVLVSRAAFWQGAASPFGSRAAWVADPSITAHSRQPLSQFPPFPLDYTVTSNFNGAPVNAQHPARPSKPARGSTIYSRYIPHLDEFFSMVHLDYTNDEHLRLFNKWQNDPRVAAGWQETGTLDEHREYLRKLDVDPHQIAILAKFNDTFFAYFEIYWAKEDHMGTYYPSQDWDRGRRSLVGEASFRGPHRATAWWTSLIHYIFLDEARTTCVVGEPQATNEAVLGYDALHGFHVYKWGDMPKKRAAMMRCERVRFFEVVHFGSAKAAKSKL